MQNVIKYRQLIWHINVIVWTWTPKYACQIHKSCEATTSSIIVGLWWSPLRYWLYHATRKFFLSQCMQSIEPTILGNPRASPICSRWLMSLLLGLLKYSYPNISLIPLTNFCKHWVVVHLSIIIYSSTQLTSDPHASIWIAVVHFCNGKRPILPTTSGLIWKYSSWLLGVLAIPMNNYCCIQNLHRNWVFVYTKFLRSSYSSIVDVHLHNCD